MTNPLPEDGYYVLKTKNTDGSGPDPLVFMCHVDVTRAVVYSDPDMTRVFIMVALHVREGREKKCHPVISRVVSHTEGRICRDGG